MTFVPHFIKLLTKQCVQAHVSFVEIKNPAADRKALAKQLHSEVVRLKNGAPATDVLAGVQP